MKVLVFVKQVPDVNDVKFDPTTNRIIREGVPLMMNSFDKKAVEEAVRLKERYGYETIIASMGPPRAADVVNEGMRMGIDSGYLITDRKFGGADTLATSTILSSFASQIGPDIILMGKYSLDGETSQVPPEVAVKLSYDFKSSISKIVVEGREAVVEHENEDGLYSLRVKLPAVFSVSEKINKARIIKPDVPDFNNSIVTIDSSALKVGSTGVELSPTVVFATRSMGGDRNCIFLEPSSDIYSRLTKLIRENVSVSGEQWKVQKPDIIPGRSTILGIALDDPQISMEIASKITSLAMSNNLNPVMIGNVDPERLHGMPSARYFHVDTRDLRAVHKVLVRFLKDSQPDYVIFPSTTRGRELAGTIAGELNLGLTADCVDLEIKDGTLIQHKPSFGGSIIASIYSKTRPAMATVRPGMFKTMTMGESFGVEELMVDLNEHEDVISFTPVPTEFQPLRSSKVVIGIGRGSTGGDAVQKALQLSKLLGGTLGASRPVVDMGIVPRQQQIGLTGSSISPDVYIAIGISGKANHVVGTRYCKRVVAVNTDPDAPIFKHADYGIIMDANKFIDGMVSHLISGVR